jgi:hypothetical protein
MKDIINTPEFFYYMLAVFALIIAVTNVVIFFGRGFVAYPLYIFAVSLYASALYKIDFLEQGCSEKRYFFIAVITTFPMFIVGGAPLMLAIKELSSKNHSNQREDEIKFIDFFLRSLGASFLFVLIMSIFMLVT